MGDSPEDKRGGGRDHPTSSSGSSSSLSSEGDQEGHMWMDKMVDGSQQPPEEDEVLPTPEEEELMEEVKLATEEAQRKSLENTEGLEGEVATLKNRSKGAHQIFGNELEEEQEQLEEKVKQLNKSLGHTSREISQKLEQIQLLTKLCNLKAQEMELRKGNVKEPTTLDKQKQVKDPGTGMAKAVARRDVVEILPEEVWEMMLGHVSDSKDLWNLCNSCQLFDTILSKWKTGWLLEQALPYLYRHLPGEKLLGCRLVCKSWRDRIDNFLEDHTSLRPHDPDKCDSRRLDFVNPMMELEIGERYQLSFSSSSDMSLFEDPAFRDRWIHTGLIGRELNLELGRDYDEDTAEEKEKAHQNENAKGGYQKMWTEFREFLSSFGKDVWHLFISFYLNDFDGGDSWEQQMLPFLLTEIVHCFPNVRTLQIRNSFAVFLGQVINSESLPPAPKLECLELIHIGATPEPLMLQRYRIQLRRLNLNKARWARVNTLDWPNLTELHLGCFESMDEFQCLVGVGVRLPHLSKLGIHLAEQQANDQETPDSSLILLRIIRELCLTTRLNTLRLEGGLWGFGVGEDKSFYDPAMVQMKTLEFDHYHTDDGDDYPVPPPNYAFLLRCCPLLENLNVFVRRYPSYYNELTMVPIAMALEDQDECAEMRHLLDLEAEPEIVEVHKYIYDGDMYKSNIWELMPLLKVFTFQWDVYTREGFEAYKEMLDKNNKN